MATQIGISRALVRDDIGTTIYDGVRVRGEGNAVIVEDKTGAVIVTWTNATATMQAPDLYLVTADQGTFYVERQAKGCGCGR